MAAKVSDDDFIAVWRQQGGEARKVMEVLGLKSPRGVYARRNGIEERHGIHLPSGGAGNGGNTRGDDPGKVNEYLQRIAIENFRGVAIVFSDAHYWPRQPPSLAHLALVKLTRELRPALLIGNGDLFDGARLSRFPRNGWEYQPKVKDELDEAMERLGEVRHAWSRARCLRTIGNHDIRYDRYLAMHASEMEQVTGARLADHLPAWEECLSVWINGHTMVKHRFRGGVHAAYNNTLHSGTNIVTGHTHFLEVKPWGDYRGRRYGVQTGAVADVEGPQFAYTEDNPKPWCSGFAVLTFDADGRLLYPELAEVIGGAVYFRGKKIVERKPGGGA